MSNKSFTSSSCETDNLFSDLESKEFVNNENIASSNYIKLEDIKDSMIDYIGLEMKRKNENITDKTDIIKNSCSDITTRNKLEAESVITFQSQDTKTNSQILVNESEETFSDESSIQSVVMNKDFSYKISEEQLYKIDNLKSSQNDTRVLKNDRMKSNKSKDKTKDGLGNSFKDQIQVLDNSNKTHDKKMFETEKFNETDNFDFETPFSSEYKNVASKRENIILKNSDSINNQIVKKSFSDQQNMKIKKMLEKTIKYKINSFNKRQLNPEKIICLVNSIKEDLKKEFSNHKILVNITIGENLNDFFKIGFECYLNVTDIFGYYALKDENIHLIASAYAILF